MAKYTELDLQSTVDRILYLFVGTVSTTLGASEVKGDGVVPESWGSKIAQSKSHV